MAKKTAPTQGLSYGWVRGEDFWGGPVNEDLLFIDAMIQPVVQSLSFATPPADATAGMCYLVAANAAGAWAGQSGKLAVLVEGSWAFYEPKRGWRVRIESLDGFFWFDGTSWLNEDTGEDPVNPGPDPTVKPTAYDISVTVSDAMYDDEAIVHLPLLDALMLPANMQKSALDMLSASQVYAQMRVQRNGQNVGTITVQAGAYTAQFTTVGGNAIQFAAGDRLTIRAPVQAVAAFKNFGFIIRLNYM